MASSEVFEGCAVRFCDEVEVDVSLRDEAIASEVFDGVIGNVGLDSRDAHAPVACG